MRTKTSSGRWPRFCRSGCPALRTGRLELFVPDEDTLLIIRTIDKGRDVFGRPFPDESRSVTIRR